MNEILRRALQPDEGNPACPGWPGGRCGINQARPRGDVNFCPGLDRPPEPCPMSGAAAPRTSPARRQADVRAWSAADARCQRETAVRELLTTTLQRQAVVEVTEPMPSDVAGPPTGRQLMRFDVEGGGELLLPVDWFANKEKRS